MMGAGAGWKEEWGSVQKQSEGALIPQDTGTIPADYLKINVFPTMF